MRISLRYLCNRLYILHRRISSVGQRSLILYSHIVGGLLRVGIGGVGLVCITRCLSVTSVGRVTAEPSPG